MMPTTDLSHLYMDAERARERMNRWGSEGRAFFLMTDYEARHCLVEPPEHLPKQALQFCFPGVRHEEPLGTPRPENFEWRPIPPSFSAYQRAFEVVRRNLGAGNSFLTNLTCATPVHTDLTLRQIFEHAHAPYRLWVRGRFTVFSPEIFVRIRNGHIYSYPMKGTIDATLPDAAERLLADAKETAEHATITDLIRNDLSRFATEVCVPRFRYIDKLLTHRGALLQMSSEIRGRLPDDYAARLGDIFFSLLPAGSITGAPKRKTLDIIREAETSPRGFYTGVMGYFDGVGLDSAVMIRFVERLAPGQLLFRSGGGITYQSRARDEYEEMKAKIYVPIY